MERGTILEATHTQQVRLLQEDRRPVLKRPGWRTFGAKTCSSVKEMADLYGAPSA